MVVRSPKSAMPPRGLRRRPIGRDRRRHRGRRLRRRCAQCWLGGGLPDAGRAIGAPATTDAGIAIVALTSGDAGISHELKVAFAADLVPASSDAGIAHELEIALASDRVPASSDAGIAHELEIALAADLVAD